MERNKPGQGGHSGSTKGFLHPEDMFSHHLKAFHCSMDPCVLGVAASLCHMMNLDVVTLFQDSHRGCHAHWNRGNQLWAAEGSGERVGRKLEGFVCFSQIGVCPMFLTELPRGTSVAFTDSLS